MSFQTNEQILRIPPSLTFVRTLDNYKHSSADISSPVAGTLDIAFHAQSGNSVLLSTCAVVLALVLGVPAAYAFARFKFWLSEDIAFHAVVLPLRAAAAGTAAAPLYFKDLGLVGDTYIGLIWVYQLIALPLILWIVRGYFEDISPTSRTPTASRAIPGRGRSSRLRCRWPGQASPRRDCCRLSSAGTNFVFALILASADKQRSRSARWLS